MSLSSRYPALSNTYVNSVLTIIPIILKLVSCFHFFSSAYALSFTKIRVQKYDTRYDIRMRCVNVCANVHSVSSSCPWVCYAQMTVWISHLCGSTRVQMRGGAAAKVLSRVRDKTQEREYAMRDHAKSITLFPFVRHFIHAGTRPYYTHGALTAHQHKTSQSRPRAIDPAWPSRDSSGVSARERGCAPDKLLSVSYAPSR